LFKTIKSFKSFKTLEAAIDGKRAMDKKDESFKDFVLDQLLGLDGVEARRMFGGYGLYQAETFFGIVHRGRIYFKIDGTTVKEYHKRRMKPFRPNAKQTLKSYYQVPPEIIEDADQIAEWARQAIRCQNKNKRLGEHR
jgi:DNA transformation protein